MMLDSESWPQLPVSSCVYEPRKVLSCTSSCVFWARVYYMSTGLKGRDHEEKTKKSSLRTRILHRHLGSPFLFWFQPKFTWFDFYCCGCKLEFWCSFLGYYLSCIRLFLRIPSFPEYNLITLSIGPLYTRLLWRMKKYIGCWTVF